MGLGAKGFFQTLLGVLRMWPRGQRNLHGHHPVKSVWQGVGSSTQKCTLPCALPTSMPCHPAFSLSLLSPQSCNTSCPSGFHGNNCSVPCECPEGNCHPVSGACQLGKVERRVQGEVTGERVALYVSSGASLLAREAGPSSETFSLLEICMGALGPPEDVTEPLSPGKPG